MHILELDSFKLSDAVKFHNRLNPKIWGKDEHLLPEVREKLIAIAADFQEFLGVSDLQVKDITVSGSNAAFSYTPHSDIDLHLVVEFPQDNEIYQELFNAKKYQYNDEHNLAINNIPVELYVQNAAESPVSQGEYSVINNDWIQVPRRKRAKIDDTCVRAKAEDLDARIHNAIKSGDADAMGKLWNKIKHMRQAGLDKHGEFGCENIAFKILRTNGCIKDLRDARTAALDREMSLREQNKPKQRKVWGFAEDAGSTPDGVSPTTCMFLNEEEPSTTEIVNQFIQHTAERLGIENMPTIQIHEDPAWSEQHHSFGMFEPETHTLNVSLPNRHLLDVLRTVAHELTHCRQHEIESLPVNAGLTGSEWENEANASAGIIMRDFADAHPEYFDNGPLKEGKLTRGIIAGVLLGAASLASAQDQQSVAGALNTALRIYGLSKVTAPQVKAEMTQELKNYLEAQRGNANAQNQSWLWQQQQQQQQGTQPVKEASGYIPTKAQARDPRYKMALTVDVHPGETGRQANKMALKTDAQGRPALLMKTANLRESLAAEFAAFAEQGMAEGKSYGYNSTPLSQIPGEREDELGNQEATGPEFPPQWPAGTTKIDVSDLTDWYRMGMDISDLDDAKPEDYNQGPPQTIVVFPSDEAEQGYLKQFKRLGLKTHDMDPDVEGGEDIYGKHMRDLAEAFEQLEEEFLGEVKMTSGNLAKLAKDIKGAKVGLEFEMIVPNAEVGDEDMEPDYDQDQRVRDIDDAVSFFDDGDYNSRNELRRLREDMEEAYFNWKIEKIDELWYGTTGWDYFVDYLDREEPFDDEEAEEEARNELQAQYGDELDVEDFEKMLFELVDEKRNNYHQEKWDEQGYEYDKAREYFEEEMNDDSDVDQESWLQSEGIRYASDVESNYGHVTWPYYTSSGDDETDIKSVALDFMNAMGMDSVAVSSSYHGQYQRWNGSEWVSIGSDKPDDCFAIEPDGSLDGDNSSDAGLEFVSPPIPLEDIGSVMQKVQNWASNYGAYTGKRNKTSIHTNISIPGYDLDKLDYLKAALLLGDEYVLREFDRIGNSYAAPAIEKVKQLVQQKPEKAQELLDKMKSQLNAEASKLIHSGQTNKFTSINTKGNRVEFRSPGGDYLDIIADNPQKMIDTINRMVVTLDAAMDPNKYKQEYQKKLYKVLTGQGGGREAKSGLKKEMKASDKDLINIFSRYAAGELPKAALKSFVRQAQLERNIKAGKTGGKTDFWWAVRRDGDVPNGPGVQVVAKTREEALTKAAKEFGLASPEYMPAATATPIRPYDTSAVKASVGEPQPVGQQPSTQFGAARGAPNYAVIRDSDGTVVYRFYADDRSEALGLKHDFVQMQGWGQRDYSLRDETESTAATREYEIFADGDPLTVVRSFYAADDQAAQAILDRYRQDHPGTYYRAHRAPVPGSTLDLQRQRQRAAAAQQNQGNWGIWIQGNNRFANQPGEYPRGAEVPLYRFPSREAAEQWLAQQRADRPGIRTDIEVREIEPREPLPDLFPELPGTPAAQQGSVVNYELYNRLTDEVIDTFPARNDNEAMTRLNDYRQFGAGQSSPDHFGVRRGPGVDNTAPQTQDQAQGGIVDVAGDDWSAEFERRVQQPATTGSFTGEWKVVDPNGREIYRFSGVGNAQSDANRVAMDWLRRNPQQMQAGVEVLPVMG